MVPERKEELSQLIREKSEELGFDLCGFAPSGILARDGVVLREWCSSGMNGTMGYLAHDIDKRINPGLIVPDAESVIVTGLSYYTGKKQGGNGVPVLSRYVYGNDYHSVIKKKLDRILGFIRSFDPGISGRTFVDSAPLLEKAWAREAGLGWQGKHSLIINKNAGSFFFIGIIVVNAVLEYDSPFAGDPCGNCRLCIDNCPAGAINDNRTIDARKCIAYITIEHRGPIPEEMSQKMGGRIFGCDKCQEVCPWNGDLKPHKTQEFEISSDLASLTREDWIELQYERFTSLFRTSAVGRVKYERLIRNIRTAVNYPES
jgi:epoxyqueuosine reductase